MTPPKLDEMIAEAEERAGNMSLTDDENDAAERELTQLQVIKGLMEALEECRLHAERNNWHDTEYYEYKAYAQMSAALHSAQTEIERL